MCIDHEPVLTLPSDKEAQRMLLLEWQQDEEARSREFLESLEREKIPVDAFDPVL